MSAKATTGMISLQRLRLKDSPQVPGQVTVKRWGNNLVLHLTTDDGLDLLLKAEKGAMLRAFGLAG